MKQNQKRPSFVRRHAGEILAGLIGAGVVGAITLVLVQASSRKKVSSTPYTGPGVPNIRDRLVFASNCATVLEGAEWWRRLDGQPGPGLDKLNSIWIENGGDAGPPLEAGAVATQIVEHFGTGTPCAMDRSMWSPAVQAWYTGFVERVQTWLDT